MGFAEKRWPESYDPVPRSALSRDQSLNYNYRRDLFTNVGTADAFLNALLESDSEVHLEHTYFHADEESLSSCAGNAWTNVG